MPRTSTSHAGKVVQFFRSTDLVSAWIVLDLCKDEVAARRQRSAEARARAVPQKKKAVKKRKKNAAPSAATD